jgi:histidyl-tRNA synthetase
MNKTPKGTIDIYGEKYNQIYYYKNTLECLFKSYGGIGLETPVFEIKENILGKYGDEAENKLVFNLEDYKSDFGEKYTLRYDLTVPKTRFIKMYNIIKGRIYSIGKVYRRDNPSKGRYREFYQADFDIIGEDTNSMINEFLLLKIANEFLVENKLENFKILINDTNYLYYLIVELLNINKDLFKSICSSIDKLDKCNFSDITDELKNKGLNDTQINKLEEFLNLKTPILEDTNIKIKTIIEYANIFGFGEKIVFTSSLARGLDYYNGIIYEIKLSGFDSSVISGGRYDNLVPNRSLIGISFGLSRISDLVEYDKKEFNETYYLTTMNDIDIKTKLEYIKKCENKFNTKIIINSEQKDKKIIKSINYCLSNKIRYIIILASDEIKENKIILKDLMNNNQKIIDI